MNATLCLVFENVFGFKGKIFSKKLFGFQFVQTMGRSDSGGTTVYITEYTSSEYRQTPILRSLAVAHGGRTVDADCHGGTAGVGARQA